MSYLQDHSSLCASITGANCNCALSEVSRLSSELQAERERADGNFDSLERVKAKYADVSSSLQRWEESEQSAASLSRMVAERDFHIGGLKIVVDSHCGTIERQEERIRTLEEALRRIQFLTNEDTFAEMGQEELAVRINSKCEKALSPVEPATCICTLDDSPANCQFTHLLR